jgi:gas vesicle protein
MAEEPEIIRDRIEETREEMDDTLDALGAKTDVKGRAKNWVSDKKDAVVGAAQSVTSKVSGAAPDGQQVKATAKNAAGMAKENPLGLAIGAAAVGFLAGLVIPSTRTEDEKLGPVADEVKDRAKELGQEAMERGKDVAQQAASSAAETAKDAASHHATELKESAQESGEEIRSTVGSANEH